MSLLNILERYKNVKTTSVDVWSDIIIEKRFNENFNNLEKIKLDSIIALRKLNDNNREFDYIYM